MTRHAVEDFAARWDVVLEDRVLDSPAGCVAFGRRRDGRNVVLKVTTLHADEPSSIPALRHFGGVGAITLLDHVDGAVLLERADPGRPLSDLVIAGRDDDATVIFCDVIAALHRPDPPHGEFPSIEDWGRGLERYRRSGDAAIPRAWVDLAIELFADLSASHARRCLLHGDLHHDNILWDDRRGWLAIDPKGVNGDPAYEIGAMLRNPTDDIARFADSGILDRRTRLLSERLGFDRRRIVMWAFAQAVLSAVWAFEDGVDPTRGLATAAAIRAKL